MMPWVTSSLDCHDADFSCLFSFPLSNGVMLPKSQEVLQKDYHDILQEQKKQTNKQKNKQTKSCKVFEPKHSSSTERDKINLCDK